MYIQVWEALLYNRGYHNCYKELDHKVFWSLQATGQNYEETYVTREKSLLHIF